jgi:hypothetical protein
MGSLHPRSLARAVCLTLAFSALFIACNKTTDPPLSGDKAITAFSFAGPAATGTIDEGAKTISLNLPAGTKVAALVASFTVSTGAGVSVGSTAQVSGTTPNDFQAANPDIAISYVNADDSKLKSGAALFPTDGSGSDVFEAWGGGKKGSYANSGNILDLTAELKDVAALPIAIQGVTWKGKVYGVAPFVGLGNLYANASILTANSLSVPTTVAEMENVAAALKAKGIQPFAVGEKDKWTGGQESGEQEGRHREVHEARHDRIGYLGRWGGIPTIAGVTPTNALLQQAMSGMANATMMQCAWDQDLPATITDALTDTLYSFFTPGVAVKDKLAAFEAFASKTDALGPLIK